MHVYVCVGVGAVDLECIIISVRTTRRVDTHEHDDDARHSDFAELRLSLSKSVTVDVVTYVIDEDDYYAAEAAQLEMEAADSTVAPAAKQLRSAVVKLTPAVPCTASCTGTVGIDLNPYGRRVVEQYRGKGKRPHERIVSDHSY